MPAIELGDVFNDLFTPIARDGASLVEVCLRLQKALKTLATIDDDRYAQNASRHFIDAQARAEKRLVFEGDLTPVREVGETVGRR